jgi:hypothetical protein
MLMFRCLRLWLLSLAAIICIDAVVMGRFEVRGITVALGALMLPFAGLLLRDYAGAPRQPNMLLTDGQRGGGGGLHCAGGGGPDAPGPAVVLVQRAGGGRCALRLRWQQLVAAPVALPVGRLAA